MPSKTQELFSFQLETYFTQLVQPAPFSLSQFSDGFYLQTGLPFTGVLFPEIPLIAKERLHSVGTVFFLLSAVHSLSRPSKAAFRVVLLQWLALFKAELSENSALYLFYLNL